MYITGIIISTV